MIWRKEQNMIILRLDPGEEMIDSIMKSCEKLDISSGFIQGIGAASTVELGAYDIRTKTYFSHRYEGVFELASVMGNLSEKDGKCYLHLHGVIGDKDGLVAAGHIKSAVISATFECFVMVVDCPLFRVPDESLGLNLLSFD